MCLGRNTYYHRVKTHSHSRMCPIRTCWQMNLLQNLHSFPFRTSKCNSIQLNGCDRDVRLSPLLCLKLLSLLGRGCDIKRYTWHTHKITRELHCCVDLKQIGYLIIIHFTITLWAFHISNEFWSVNVYEMIFDIHKFC